jgi:RNA polymerase sigma-70 factor (ECF subfamily)
MLETDTQLIEKALAGDRAASGRLVERHRRSVVATAHRALGNADDASDVAQEALILALQRLPTLREPGAFCGWLRHITLSLCVDYRRRRGTRRLGEPITGLHEASEERCFVEHLVVQQALAHLSADHRTTVLLHYVGGWSVAEVAELLYIPANTVRSRLMAAKRTLRTDLTLTYPPSESILTMPAVSSKPMPDVTLSDLHRSLISSVFPNARILAVQDDPEPWMPFRRRVRLAMPGGDERSVDLRDDIDAGRAALALVLARLGIAAPRLLAAPMPNGTGDGGYWSLCEAPVGENLLLWALGGTPHRIRLASERAFEAIDRLQGITDRLLVDPIGAALPRRTLADDAALVASASASTAWSEDPWYRDALARVQSAVADIHDPLVFTDYLHFFPNFYRIHAGADPFAEPMGWPGDPRLTANPLAEFVSPFGYIGDPLLGLAMVWIYDCYPFVHTGFVEQFLWRRGVTRRDFASRLALHALRVIQRELPFTDRVDSDGRYWDALHGFAEQALGWM